MGCDIHFYVEKLDGEVWKSIDQWDTEDAGTGHEWTGVNWEKRFYNGRNYNLFAILADVRNGRGFAGISTGEGFNPIVEPKGIPENASQEYLKQCQQWEGDGHSHSFFTLKELIDFDWTQKTILRGYVTSDEFYQWRKYCKSDADIRYDRDYCGDVSGQNILKIEQSEATEILEIDRAKFKENLAKKYPGKDVYVNINWGILYSECCEDFLLHTLMRLMKECDGDLNSVRICFFFDN